MESIMTRKRKKGKLVTFAISLIVLFFAGIMYMQIKDSRAELGTLHRQETKLEHSWMMRRKRQNSWKNVRFMYRRRNMWKKLPNRSVSYIRMR